MKAIKTMCTFLISLFLTGSIHARQTENMKLSLHEAQQYAIENFYMSKNAGLDIQSAKWRVWETTALGFPQVSASASYQHIPGEIPVFSFEIPGIDTLGFDFGEPSAIAVRNSVTYGFTVSQLLFSGEYIIGLQAARVYKSMSEEINEKSAIEIKQSVADSYFGLLILKENRVVLEKTLANLLHVFQQVEISFRAGLTEDTEVDQLNLVVKRTENSLATIGRQIAFMTNLFKYQIGLDPQVTVELTDNIDELLIENLVNETAYGFILEENIDYQVLTTQEKLNQLLMRREQSKYLPGVVGFYQYQDKTRKADFDFTINHIIGIQVNLPIVTSGSRMAQVSQARIEYEKAQNMREQEINRLFMTAQQAAFDYRTALEQYNNEKLNLELSRKVYDKTSEKYKEGFVSSLELSLVNNQYLQARMSYSATILELLNSKIKLDKAYNKL